MTTKKCRCRCKTKKEKGKKKKRPPPKTTKSPTDGICSPIIRSQVLAPHSSTPVYCPGLGLSPSVLLGPKSNALPPLPSKLS